MANWNQVWTYWVLDYWTSSVSLGRGDYWSFYRIWKDWNQLQFPIQPQFAMNWAMANCHPNATQSGWTFEWFGRNATTLNRKTNDHGQWAHMRIAPMRLITWFQVQKMRLNEILVWRVFFLCESYLQRLGSFTQPLSLGVELLPIRLNHGEILLGNASSFNY